MLKVFIIKNNNLLRYRTKSDMPLTFVSGILLSSAVNILTNDTSRKDLSEAFSMLLMFLSSILFFIIAVKVSSLKTWYYSLPDISQTDEMFLTGTDEWHLGKFKDFYKVFLPTIQPMSWVLGIISLPIYLWGDDMWKCLYSLLSCIENWICRIF